jgi:hypothetical protein
MLANPIAASRPPQKSRPEASSGGCAHNALGPPQTGRTAGQHGRTCTDAASLHNLWMGLKRPVVLGLVASCALGACDNYDRVEARPTPDASVPLDPSGDLDASPPDSDLDAAANAPDASDSAMDPPHATCQALSNACPFLQCDDFTSTLAAASARCNAPPFVRTVTQGSACGRTIAAYRYGAGDTTIVFFDSATGALTGWWNVSDTGSIACSGEVDRSCAAATEASLSYANNCLPDAGAGGTEDAGAADSGS